jgi:uncharacterized membrane protein (DUF4010 family)
VFRAWPHELSGGMGQRAKAMPAARPSAVAAALLSNVPTVIQLGVIFAALAPALLRPLAPALLAAGVSATLVALAYSLRTRNAAAHAEPAAIAGRPFDFRHALLFAAIIAAALLLSAMLHRWIGDGGVVVAAAAAGLADVHAAAASIGQLSAHAALPMEQAVFALGAAFVTNSVVKCIAAYGAGGAAFARPLLAGLMLINLAFLGALALA